MAVCGIFFFAQEDGVACVESATGINEGCKTGLAAVVKGILFLPFMFLFSLLLFVPEPIADF